MKGFAFGARLCANETCVVGRRYNKSLDRSAFSRLFIRRARMPGSLSPRPVNSNVIAPRTNGKTCSLNHGLNGFAFGARLGADETCVVGRRYNKSLDRSAFSRLFIRKTRMPGSSSPRPVNSNVIPPQVER